MRNSHSARGSCKLALIKSILDVRLPEDDGIEFAPVLRRPMIIRDHDAYWASG